MFRAVITVFILSSTFADQKEKYIDHHHHPQPYHFGYHIKDKHGSQYRKEEGDSHKSVKGSYGYTDEHGIHREVHYIADHHGFRAEIKTNEQGTANQDPANIKLHSHASQHHHYDHHHKKYHHDQHEEHDPHHEKQHNHSQNHKYDHHHKKHHHNQHHKYDQQIRHKSQHHGQIYHQG